MTKRLINFIFILFFICGSSFAQAILDSQDKFNLFLLMGLTRESGHWPVETHTKLKKRFPNANIVFLDLPGAGKLYQMESPETIPEYVDIIRQKNLKKLKNGLPNVIIATSLGGMVASDWAKRFPSEFDKVTLVASSLKGVCRLDERARIKTFPKLLGIYFSRNIETREHRVLSINSNNPDEKSYLIERYVQLQKERPISRKNIKNQTLAGKRYRFEGVIKSDVLILGSKKDKLVKPSCIKKMARRFNADMAMHETSGHGIPIDDLDWIINQQAVWMNKN